MSNAEPSWEKGEENMATKFEQAFAKMTPAQRKKATAAIGDMMGMPTKKKKAAGSKRKK